MLLEFWVRHVNITFDTCQVHLRILSHILRDTVVSFWQCHGNETLGSVRGRIANKLRQPTDNVQIVAQDKMVGGFLNFYICTRFELWFVLCTVVATVSILYTLQLDSQKDQKLLHQLEFEDNQLIQVRLTTPTLQPLGKEVSSYSNLNHFNNICPKKITMYCMFSYTYLHVYSWYKIHGNGVTCTT